MISRKQRIPFADLSKLDAEARDTMRKNQMQGRDFNIFKVLMHHPKLAKRWTVFAGHILGKQTLPFRDRELAILRIGWLNQAEYEWAQHVEIAKRGGITDADIDNIRRAPRPRAGAPPRRRCCRRSTTCSRTPWCRTRPGPPWPRPTAPSR